MARNVSSSSNGNANINGMLIQRNNFMIDDQRKLFLSDAPFNQIKKLNEMKEQKPLGIECVHTHQFRTFRNANTSTRFHFMRLST